jgi:hypothetical protein
MILLVFRRKKLWSHFVFDLTSFADNIYQWREASELRNSCHATTFTEPAPAISTLKLR